MYSTYNHAHIRTAVPIQRGNYRIYPLFHTPFNWRIFLQEKEYHDTIMFSSSH
jgi:hypothetical protein